MPNVFKIRIFPRSVKFLADHFERCFSIFRITLLTFESLVSFKFCCNRIPFSLISSLDGFFPT